MTSLPSHLRPPPPPRAAEVARRVRNYGVWLGGGALVVLGLAGAAGVLGDGTSTALVAAVTLGITMAFLGIAVRVLVLVFGDLHQPQDRELPWLGHQARLVFRIALAACVFGMAGGMGLAFPLGFLAMTVGDQRLEHLVLATFAFTGFASVVVMLAAAVVWAIADVVVTRRRRRRTA